MANLIFAIETSCDETSAAVLENSQVLSNVITSQYFHSKYGGIVPELASRAHIENIYEICEKAIEISKINRSEITLVTATKGPGLIGSLLVGYNFAKSFAIANKAAFLGIDHIESHIFSSFIGQEEIEFPFISLVVSGGHTIIFLAEGYNKIKVVGNTADDAAGEAFDKTAKMLGLEYPGGPIIEKLAKQGNAEFHKFPKSNIKTNPFDFSFSGIKTSVYYFIRDFERNNKQIPINDICASFQRAIIEVLFEKTVLASRKFNCKIISVSGGVSANNELRNKFSKLIDEGYKIYFPEKKYTTDNAAMIGYYAYLKYKHMGKDIADSGILENAYARFQYN